MISTFESSTSHYTTLTICLLHRMYISQFVHYARAFSIIWSLSAQLCSLHKNCPNRVTRKNDWKRRYIRFYGNITNRLIDTICMCLNAIATCFRSPRSVDNNVLSNLLIHGVYPIPEFDILTDYEKAGWVIHADQETLTLSCLSLKLSFYVIFSSVSVYHLELSYLPIDKI